MLREKLVICALDPKLDRALVTLVLTSAPKFLWLVVHFDKYIDFGMRQKLCPKILIPGFGHSWRFTLLNLRLGNILWNILNSLYKCVVMCIVTDQQPQTWWISKIFLPGNCASLGFLSHIESLSISFVLQTFLAKDSMANHNFLISARSYTD